MSTFRLPCSFALAVLMLAGCDCSPPMEATCTSATDCASGQECRDGRCVARMDAGRMDAGGCQSNDDCAPGLVCELASGTCVDAGCEPGSFYCEAGALFECSAPPRRLHGCASGACEGDRCACESGEACLEGEVCADAACRCVSATYCESPQVCCSEGSVCLDTVNCDDEGLCRFAQRCAPACEEGQRCGEGGQLCCGGDTPVCGPLDECVTDCGERARCGEAFDTCCDEGEVCQFGTCFPLGAECTRFIDCDFGEYCEPTLGRCVADDFPEGIECRRPGDFEDFLPELRWHWEGVEIGGQLYEHVAATPMVGDVNDDGFPNVVFPAYRTGGTGSPALVVLDGRDGSTLYTNTTHSPHSWGQVALADVDGDGLTEIIVSTTNGVGVVENLSTCPDPAADAMGCYRWHTSAGIRGELGPLVADLRADGTTQIVVDRVVLDANTGDVIATLGSGSAYPSVADVTDDGRLEVLSHGCAYRLTDADPAALEQVWCTSGVSSSGLGVFSAIGDVARGDRAGAMEVIWVGSGRVTIAAGDTGAPIRGWDIPGGGGGGPPTVADFDGDGRAEVGVASQGCYTVFDLDCPADAGADAPGCARPTIPPCTQGVDCFDHEVCPAYADTGGTGDGILWTIYVQDISSSRTGSSVFDFQGDDRNEVVYNDECLLMVLDGRSGAPLFRVPNTSRTASEYPVVVDVTGDGQTNIVVPANSDQFWRDCAHPMGLRADPGYPSQQPRPDRYPECFTEEGDPPAPDWCTEGTRGVFAYQDAADRWVRTRAIWNQFGYHIDNVGERGEIPATAPRPWTTHNTFRANRQGEVPLNASDPRVDSIRVLVDGCPARIRIVAVISNQGTRAIPRDLPVTLYRTDGASPERVETQLTTEPISPGGVAVLTFDYELAPGDIDEELSFRVVANDDGTGEPVIFDCNPDAASRDAEGVRCDGLR